MSNENGDEALARRIQQEEQDSYEAMLAEREQLPIHSTPLADWDDPNPDLHTLFLAFNAAYFGGQLDMVEVKWSSRMTLCAGLCCYQPGGLCTVKLSEPLLKYRSRQDMINTLLHEMIHALLFVTKKYDNHDDHGPEFLKEATRINRSAGTSITVFHNFHDEVDHYRKHVWQCDGACQEKPPYFGVVKRSMNRAPQKADPWFAEHQLTCGGIFHKIAEPDAKKGKKRTKDMNKLQLDIAGFFTSGSDMKEAAKRRKLQRTNEASSSTVPHNDVAQDTNTNHKRTKN